MTVKEHILEIKQNTVNSFKKLNPPSDSIVAKRITVMENQIKNKSLGPVDGLDQYLDTEVKTFSKKTGRYGKEYLQFELFDGKILNYFPSARFGPFAKLQEIKIDI